MKLIASRLAEADDRDLLNAVVPDAEAPGMINVTLIGAVLAGCERGLEMDHADLFPSTVPPLR